MLDTHQVRELLVSDGGHFCAASGLVRRSDFLYVIGDDSNDLGVFPMQGGAGTTVPIFDGPLPTEHKARKAAKPDLEALTGLPPFEDHPNGALLALGSGSTEARRRGFVWGLEEDGSLSGERVVLELAPLYEAIAPQVRDLNIEGVAVSEGRLLLFQRGNSETGLNAVIELGLDDIVRDILEHRAVEASEIHDLRAYDLGDLRGVKLTFTDADGLPDGRMVFTCAAEDTSNPYDDGEIVGSAVGIMDADGDVERLEPLSDSSHKVEGVDAVLSDELIHLLMVCDADDASIPSPLLSATMPAVV
jgi:hypothetical protein